MRAMNNIMMMIGVLIYMSDGDITVGALSDGYCRSVNVSVGACFTLPRVALKMLNIYITDQKLMFTYTSM